MSPSENTKISSAIEDFHLAHQKATMEELLSRLLGKSNSLLSFDEVAEKLKLQARAERGVQDIPLDAIVGSVGRYTDFTRTFLPRNPSDEQRWANVKASLEESGFPPIDVYKVSDVYFVLDGNHRVSVARQEGWKTIQANVIEVKSNVPLTPDTNPDELIIKSEYAAFLEETGLHEKRPNVDLTVTIPGQYEKLIQQIHVHRYYAWVDRQLELSFEEAMLDWYDNIYIPFAETVRDRGLMRWFPDRTITDLYLWVSEHREVLQSQLGWIIRPQAIAEVLVDQVGGTSERYETGSWRRAKMVERYTEHLFKDVLVPLSDRDEGWQAVQQAIWVAQREGAALQGLHIEDSPEKLQSPAARDLQARFNQLCQESGLRGSLALEVGEPAPKILERSPLADLVVLKVNYPPAAGISGLASPLRTIIARAGRPILAVPGKFRPISRALLAFDGSARAKEALFLAAYLAERWQVELTVFTALENGRLSDVVQEEARAYMELHEVQADYVVEKGSADSVRPVIAERGLDLIIMGGYSGLTLKEFFIGSNVNLVLRESTLPVLICR
jgi:nucleotide-binding universal stress UspA family protein/uncharacterized ParB-like nuclease family protein